MQEVGEKDGFLSGELDYFKMKGDTGPLVYPAGFVYLYSALYYITQRVSQSSFEYCSLSFLPSFLTKFHIIIGCQHSISSMVIPRIISRCTMASHNIISSQQ
jgi:hypothetical protein